MRTGPTPIRVLLESLEKLSPVMLSTSIAINYESVARGYDPNYGYFNFPKEPDFVRVSLEFVVPMEEAKDAGFEPERRQLPVAPHTPLEQTDDVL